jgi:hypothetical protein
MGRMGDRSDAAPAARRRPSPRRVLQGSRRSRWYPLIHGQIRPHLPTPRHPRVRRTPIPLEDLIARLGCSKATLYRAINVLKDTLHAPVEFDADAGGFRYAVAQGSSAFELPGSWFTPT